MNVTSIVCFKKITNVLCVCMQTQAIYIGKGNGPEKYVTYQLLESNSKKKFTRIIGLVQ